VVKQTGTHTTQEPTPSPRHVFPAQAHLLSPLRCKKKLKALKPLHPPQVWTKRHKRKRQTPQKKVKLAISEK
jgi:hypothetical protein